MAKVYEAMLLSHDQAPEATKQFLNDYNFADVIEEPIGSVEAEMIALDENNLLDMDELGLETESPIVTETVETNVAVAEAIADSVNSLANSLEPEAHTAAVHSLTPLHAVEPVASTNMNPELVPESYRAEFRQLGEIVTRAASQRTLKAILVCGVEAHDQADFVVENLSLALAESPERRIARFRLVSPTASIARAVSPEDFRIKIQRTGIINLCEVVPVNGAMPISQLIRDCDITQMMEMLKQRFDFILLETDAVNFADDVATFAGKTDGVILVAQKENMRGPGMSFAREKLQKAGATILGAVLSRSREPEQYQRVA